MASTAADIKGTGPRTQTFDPQTFAACASALADDLHLNPEVYALVAAVEDVFNVVPYPHHRRDLVQEPVVAFRVCVSANV
jgi:hypothetical protein